MIERDGGPQKMLQMRFGTARLQMWGSLHFVKGTWQKAQLLCDAHFASETSITEGTSLDWSGIWQFQKSWIRKQITPYNGRVHAIRKYP